MRRCERGWKLFLLAPRMLLFRRPRGGSISKEKLTDRFAKFARGEWTELLAWSHACAEEAGVASRRRQRRPENQEELRAARALALVQLGELSSARQALEGAESPPEFQLEEEDLFWKTFRSTKRGSAAGPSGMTNEHIRILLDNHSDAHLMFLAGEQLAQARVPPSIVRVVRQGRMTALRKDDGGVRGINCGGGRTWCGAWCPGQWLGSWARR